MGDSVRTDEGAGTARSESAPPASLFARLGSPRVLLAFVLVFCGFYALLVWQSFQAQDRLRAAADARLVSESKRRASLLGAFAAEQRNFAAALAHSHELQTYLINRSLGMSPRYGLNLSIDTLETRFREYVEAPQAGGNSAYQRIVYVDRTGKPLADTAGPGASLPPSLATATGTALVVDPVADRLLAVSPVHYKGEIEGAVIVFIDTALLDHLVPPSRPGDPLRETIVSTEGREIPVHGMKPVFDADFARAIPGMPENLPVVAREVAAHGDYLADHADSILIKVDVPGMPVSLVTAVSGREAYGDATPRLFLYSAAACPLFVLVAGSLLYQSQRRTRRLRAQVADGDRRRRELQGRNVELAAEISRRIAVEQQLQTHQDQLEDLVAQRTSELKSLFQALPDLYFRLSCDGTILDYRAGRDADLYTRPGDFLGRKLGEVMPTDVAGLLEEAITGIRNGESYRSFEYSLTMNAGMQFYEARLLPLGEDQIVSVVRDITERKNLEQMRDEALREANRLARIKSDFLANMSHEIRTPLNAVLGFAHLGYRRSSDSDPARATFGRILESGNLLLNLLNDVLDFSKIEAGMLRIESTAANPAEVVADAVDLLRERAEAKGIALALDLSPDLPPACMTDPLRLKQVLVNLLSNAVKFTESGGIAVYAGRDGGDLLFRVRDSGIGMTAEQMGRLFVPFEQADGSTTRRFGGTGLGLAICRRIVDLMRGSIHVDSLPGAGSSFAVRIPLVEVPVPSIYAASRPLPDAQGTPRLAGLRILVAEDNPVNQMVLDEGLAAEGATVVMAANGEEAVDLVANEGAARFDLVLMDIQMPVLDGLEATRRILAIAPDLPVVGQSAYAFGEDRDACMAAGMVDHVAKPIDWDKLVEVVRRYVRGRLRTAIDGGPDATAGPARPGAERHGGAGNPAPTR